MRYRLLRNATAVLGYGEHVFLIDPALDAVGERPPVANTPNQRRNPLVDLPDGWRAAVDAATAVIQTHLHRDHWDDADEHVLDRALPVYVQPQDADSLRAKGFLNVHPVESVISIGEVSLTRVPAQHGTGDIARAMAPVSGYVLRATAEPTVYLAGDTIWYDAVADTITTYAPEVIVVNGGGARFLEGDPIVMSATDIAAVQAAAPQATVVVQHLEAINHCLETRAYYREELPRLGVDMRRLVIPADGEVLHLS